MPAEALLQAERIARAKGIKLSAVISEALSDGPRKRAAVERSEEVLSAYENAFTGFSEAELLVLDGIIIEPPASRG